MWSSRVDLSGGVDTIWALAGALHSLTRKSGEKVQDLWLPQRWPEDRFKHKMIYSDRIGGNFSLEFFPSCNIQRINGLTTVSLANESYCQHNPDFLYLSAVFSYLGCREVQSRAHPAFQLSADLS